MPLESISFPPNIFLNFWLTNFFPPSVSYTKVNIIWTFYIYPFGTIVNVPTMQQATFLEYNLEDSSLGAL